MQYFASPCSIHCYSNQHQPCPQKEARRTRATAWRCLLVLKNGTAPGVTPLSLAKLVLNFFRVSQRLKNVRSVLTVCRPMPTYRCWSIIYDREIFLPSETFRSQILKLFKSYTIVKEVEICQESLASMHALEMSRPFYRQRLSWRMAAIPPKVRREVHKLQQGASIDGELWLTVKERKNDLAVTPIRIPSNIGRRWQAVSRVALVRTILFYLSLFIFRVDRYAERKWPTQQQNNKCLSFKHSPSLLHLSSAPLLFTMLVTASRKVLHDIVPCRDSVRRKSYLIPVNKSPKRW